jgi:hypothetical protein
MELKPEKGLKVRVYAAREAVFGEEGVGIQKVSFDGEKTTLGTLTGMTLAGFCEVEMPDFDGKKHWYPIESLKGENGENLIEEEIAIEAEEKDAEEKEDDSLEDE